MADQTTPKNYKLLILGINNVLIRSYMENDKAVRPYADVTPLPNRIEKIRALVASGQKIAFVTNEGGISLGYDAEHDFYVKWDRIRDAFGLPDNTPLAFCFAHKKTTGERYLADLDRRLPSPAMLQELTDQCGVTADETLVVPGRWELRAAAQALGIKYKMAPRFFGDPRPNQWRQVENELLGTNDAWERRPAKNIKITAWLTAQYNNAHFNEWAWIVERKGEQIPDSDSIGVANTAELAKAAADTFYKKWATETAAKTVKDASKKKPATKDTAKPSKSPKRGQSDAVANKPLPAKPEAPKVIPAKWEMQPDGSFALKPSKEIMLVVGTMGRKWHYAGMNVHGIILGSKGTADDEATAKQLATDWFKAYNQPTERPVKAKVPITIKGL